MAARFTLKEDEQKDNIITGCKVGFVIKVVIKVNSG